MRVSELAERSGVPVATIHHYLREGLLPVAIDPRDAQDLALVDLEVGPLDAVLSAPAGGADAHELQDDGSAGQVGAPSGPALEALAKLGAQSINTVPISSSIPGLKAIRGG